MPSAERKFHDENIRHTSEDKENYFKRSFDSIAVSKRSSNKAKCTRVYKNRHGIGSETNNSAR